MWKLLTFDGRLALRDGFLRHTLSAATLLLVGFLVLAFAHLGGASPAATVNRGQSLPTCAQPTTTTAAAFEFGGHPRTVTVTKTKTKTAYKTRTKTVCLTTTETGPTTTLTTTVTVTETGPTTTVTEKGPTTTVTEQGLTTTVTEQGPTTTVTTTKTVSVSGFTCPSADQVGFALGTSDYTVDPITCSYPAFAGEDPNDFFCSYSSSTGALVTDHDAGFCPAAATPKT